MHLQHLRARRRPRLHRRTPRRPPPPPAAGQGPPRAPPNSHEAMLPGAAAPPPQRKLTIRLPAGAAESSTPAPNRGGRGGRGGRGRGGTRSRSRTRPRPRQGRARAGGGRGGAAGPVPDRAGVPALGPVRNGSASDSRRWSVSVTRPTGHDGTPTGEGCRRTSTSLHCPSAGSVP